MISRAFPRHTNPSAYRAGLVIQTKPEIDGDETGLKQATLRFKTFNENYPRLMPDFGASCDKFRGGDDLTRRVLKEMSFLGKHTEKWTRGGGSKVGILEILCKGAIFDPKSDPNDPITRVYTPEGTTLTTIAFSTYRIVTAVASVVTADDTTDVLTSVNEHGLVIGDQVIFSSTVAVPAGLVSGTQYFIVADGFSANAFKVSATAGGAVIDLTNAGSGIITATPVNANAYKARYNVTIDYYAIDLHFQYVALKKVRLPRFVKEDGYPIDKAHPGNTPPAIKRPITATIADASLGIVGGAADIPDSEWLPWINYLIVQSQFDQVPAGFCQSVTETGTVTMVPKIPSPIV